MRTVRWQAPSDRSRPRTIRLSELRSDSGGPPDELSLAFVYGNTCRPLEMKRRVTIDGVRHTREWTLYVRPYRDTWDMGSFIKKVVFRTHPNHPDTTIKQVPFEITRTGWGEYYVTICLYFRPPIKPGKILKIDYPLMLFKRLPSSSHRSGETLESNQFVADERYDEIVIAKPSVEQEIAFRRARIPGLQISDGGCQHQLACKRTLEKMDRAKRIVLGDVAAVKEKIRENLRASEYFREKLRERVFH